MRDLFAKHEGRQVNTWGDTAIAEVSSVVEAMRCAIDQPVRSYSVNVERRNAPHAVRQQTPDQAGETTFAA